jgi:hypothetical protein
MAAPAATASIVIRALIIFWFPRTFGIGKTTTLASTKALALPELFDAGASMVGSRNGDSYPRQNISNAHANPLLSCGVAEKMLAS